MVRSGRFLNRKINVPALSFSDRAMRHAMEWLFLPAGACYASAAATVTRLDIPFLHLLAFFLKAVIAAIPALILLMVLLWLAGEALTATFPDLVKMQVLIRLPQ